MEEGSVASRLRRGFSVRRRGRGVGSCTTPAPSWSNHRQQRGSGAVSARRLGANLWEALDFGSVWKTVERRGFQLDGSFDHDDDDQTGSLRGYVAESFSQLHKTSDSSHQAPPPASPRSFSSSTEVEAFNQSLTSRSSSDLKKKFMENVYNFKTSTEFLKVLNRIWSLEEQQESNILLIKELRSELDHARARIQELIHDQLEDHQVIDRLLHKLDEDELVKKSEEHKLIKTAVKSIKNELANEKKMRMHFESLLQKLVEELSEVKSSHCECLKDLEWERKIRTLLEDLCDKFAEAITTSEPELGALKGKSGGGFNHSLDRWVLHISEAWLDQRLQMKLAEGRGDSDERNVVLCRLVREVEAFLRLVRETSYDGDITAKKAKEDGSLHLHGRTCVPHAVEDEDLTGGMHCFELNMSDDGLVHCDFDNKGHTRDMLDEKRSYVREKIGYFENIVNHKLVGIEKSLKEMDEVSTRNQKELLVQENIHEAHANCAKNNRDLNVSESQTYEVSGNGWDDKHEYDCLLGMNSMTGSLRDQCQISECSIISGTNPTEKFSDFQGDFVYECTVSQGNFHDAPSNIEMPYLPSHSRRCQNDDSLKAKLLEARTESQLACLRRSYAATTVGK